MKLLKRISIFVSMVLASAMAKAADYEIKAADLSVIEGGTAVLAIELKNAGDVVGFQCDISLPEGVKLSGEMTMSRHQDGVHTLVNKEQSDGSMRVLVYSNPNTPFTGNAGVVLNVPLSVEAPIGSYSISLKNPVITAPGAVAYYVEPSSVTLTVKPKYIDANAVTLNKSSLELLLGGSERLSATVSPDNATDKTVVWTSSDSGVATVDANGNVTAVAIGSATITASCGSVKAECKVTVLPIAVAGVTLNKTEIELFVGGSERLNATVSPDNATDKTVVWTSSDSDVATVDANGNVTAVAIGSATITASCGSVKAECKVTVLKKQQTITWSQTFADIMTGDTLELNATASSGLDVVYTVLEGDATLRDNCLTVNKPGRVKIEASQPGNEEYEAAKSVIKTIDVVTGITDIEKGSSKIKFFDMNGSPISNPKKGIYIKVEQGKVTKVVM